VASVVMFCGCNGGGNVEQGIETAGESRQITSGKRQLHELQKELRYGMTAAEVQKVLSDYGVGGGGNPETGWWFETYYDPERNEVLSARFSIMKSEMSLSEWSLQKVNPGESKQRPKGPLR